MNILPPLQAGLSGVTRGMENLQEIASDIAQAGTKSSASSTGGSSSTADLSQSIVELQAQEQATLAAVKVVGATNEVLGSLLDVNT